LAFAVDFRAPSFPLFSAERVGYQTQFRSTTFPKML
jgi:hypothetical protein